MFNKLRLKILAGFMLMAIMMAAAGSLSIFEFVKLSNSVSTIIENNYKSIELAKKMMEALEREDSGILLVLLDQEEEGRKTIAEGDSIFLTALHAAKQNITEPNEAYLLDQVGESYYRYKSALWTIKRQQDIDQLPIHLYKELVYHQFNEVKTAVNVHLELNQSNMFSTANNLRERAYRSFMPGLVGVIGAVIFALLYQFVISRYVINPMQALMSAINEVHRRNEYLHTNIDNNDELKQVEKEINAMIHRISADK